MSKIETASKVSLNPGSRINLGRRGARAPSPRPWTQPTSPAHSLERVKAGFENILRNIQVEGRKFVTHKKACNVDNFRVQVEFLNFNVRDGKTTFSTGVTLISTP